MPGKGAKRINSAAIISDLQDDRLSRPAKPHVHLAGTGMLDGIVQGLLCDAVEFLFDLEPTARILAQVDLDPDIVACLQCPALLDQRPDQPLPPQRLTTPL